MISIIVTAYHEETTIAKAIQSILVQLNGLDEECELIVVCPDSETLNSAKIVLSNSPLTNYHIIKDESRGKPAALNLATKIARGRIIIATDGDVYLAGSALQNILAEFKTEEIGGVTGRPVCQNNKATYWGYIGHLFMDGAHKKRQDVLLKQEFFPMSGYLLAMQNLNLTVPEDVLDDVYYSYKIAEAGKKIVYAENALVYVKQPENLNDWFKQKIRSLSGYTNTKQFSRFNVKTRTFTSELRYLIFPLTYAKGVKEFCWSLSLYPLRLALWVGVLWNTKLKKRTAQELWMKWRRIESTK